MAAIISPATKAKKTELRRANGPSKRKLVLAMLRDAQFKTKKKTNAVALIRKDRL